MLDKQPYYTDYHTAVHWCGNDYVLCNNIPVIDPSVYGNARFDWSKDTEIFQWYLTDAGIGTIEYLEKTFGLLFTYSDALDLWALCVDHWGTSWDYVPCQVYSDTWIKFNGDKFKFRH